MKNNIYVQHAGEIVAISKEKDVDMSVATEIFITENSLTKNFEDYKEWIHICNTAARERKHILDFVKENA